MDTVVTTSVPGRPRSDDGARRRWFSIDALVTGANGLAYLVAAPLLVDLFGSTEGTIRLIGVFLAVFACAVGAYARQRTARVDVGRAMVAVNAAWIAASLIVAALGPAEVTALGRAWIVAQAAVVGVLAQRQGSSLRGR